MIVFTFATAFATPFGGRQLNIKQQDRDGERTLAKVLGLVAIAKLQSLMST